MQIPDNPLPKNILLFGLLLLLFLGSTGNLYGSSKTPALLLYSGNIQGETEPCG